MACKRAWDRPRESKDMRRGESAIWESSAAAFSRGLPPSAQHTNQCHGGVLAVRADLRQRAARVEGSHLRGHHVGVAQLPGVVAVEHLLLRLVSGFGGLAAQGFL